MSCIDITELEKFLEGKIEPDRLIAVDEHLSGCTSCKAALDSLASRRRAVASFAAELIGVSDCPDYQQLSALIDESLDADESRRLLAHLNMCELCSRDVESIRALRSQALLRGAVHVHPRTARRAGVWAGSWWKKVVGAAAVAAVVVVAAVTYVGRPASQHPAPPKAPATTVVTHAPEPVQPKPEPTGKPTQVQPGLVAQGPDTRRQVPPAPTPLLKDGRYQLVKAGGRYAMAKIDGKLIKT
ncbi:MAG: hypothetical protein ACP5R5_09560, partial [Armatimonadota bacterium]